MIRNISVGIDIGKRIVITCGRVEVNETAILIRKFDQLSVLGRWLCLTTDVTHLNLFQALQGQFLVESTKP